MSPQKISFQTAQQAANELPLDELLKLFAGIDAWHFPGCASAGYPPLQVADCGHGVTLVAPPYGSATCFPTSVGMAATWNKELIQEVGQVLGRETRAKDCGMLLGPMVNLHRLPCGGRNFESFSEDPVLAGKLAAAIIRGIQSEGTAACIKGFACNNQQHAQKDTSSIVDERTLRELYFKPFAIALEESAPWAIMTSYNSINNQYPGDSAYWLKQVVRGEMGYTGLIVSDWDGIQSDHVLTASLDMEMPGPARWLTPTKLKHALAQDLISEKELRERAARVLKLHALCTPARTGEGAYSPPELDSPRHRALCRQVAEESITLLKNENAQLPLDPNRIRRIAVIGPNATCARLGGGGSASVSPFYSVSALEGIRALVGEQVEVLYTEGCSLGNATPVVPAEALAPLNGDFGEGLYAEYFDIQDFAAGKPAAYSRIEQQVDFSWGWAAPADGVPRIHYSARWSGQLQIADGGLYKFTVTTQEGVARVRFNGVTVLDAWSDWQPDNFEAGYANRNAEFSIEYEAGTEIDLVIEYQKTGTRGGVHFGWNTPHQRDSIQAAEDLARTVDAVVIVAGLSNQFEGGDYDRKQFALPAPQPDLIRRVSDANPNTTVVLNNGTPVQMQPWIDHVPAVLEAYYPGQEGGHALARVLFGVVNPSGKLPDTIPNSWEEVPSMSHYPGKDGFAEYKEGLNVGYRHYDSTGITPAFSFGFGLSYSEFDYNKPHLSADTLRIGESIELEVEITNISNCAGKETAQLYLCFPDASDRPPRQLLDFVKIALAPGKTRTARFTVRHQDVLTYNTQSMQWQVEYPKIQLAVGGSPNQLQYAEIQIVD